MLGQLQDAGNTNLNQARTASLNVYYWSNRNREVDFVVRKGRALVAIEVKSGRRRTNFPGLEAFATEFKPTRKPLIGGSGMPLEEFLLLKPEAWLG